MLIPQNNYSTDSIIHRLLPLALLSVLMVLCYKIVVFFISPVIWAAILAYVTWPIYTKLHNKLNKSANASALLMTTALTLLIGIPLVVGVIMLQGEAVNLYTQVLERINNGYLSLPKVITDLPNIGPYLKESIDKINQNPEQTLISIREWIQSHLSYGKEIVDVFVKNMARFGIALMCLFFFYRDGRLLLRQIRQASRQILGEQEHGYFTAMGMTTQAVVYGIGLTAIAQALLAGVGYFFAGAPSPILLTLVTLFVAMIPFGTPVAWGSVVIYLFSQGQTTEAIGLGLWCMLVVSWVDNIIRPMVISGATKIPFMIILIGVLGGLTAFGFIGLFIGPVVLAVALAVWREWLAQHVEEVNSITTILPVVTDDNQSDLNPDDVLDDVVENNHNTVEK